MLRKVLCIALCLYVFNEVSGKPTNPTDLKDRDLVDEFVEFLHKDKQLSAVLEREFDPNTITRNRRQTELDDMNMNLDDTPQEKQEGFFDRAAKFMMELLQRFLKWVNTE